MIRSTLIAENAVEATVRQRFEAKYLLNTVQRELVRDYILGYTRPDAHNAMYPVTSVYYDGDAWTTFHASMYGERNRFKLRVRSYGDGRSQGCFTEVKQRMDQIVTKKRARLRCSLAEAVEDGAVYRSDMLTHPDNPADRGAFEYFHWLAGRLDATPRAGVRYMREAFQSVVDEPVRLTIDSELSYAPAGRAGLNYRDASVPWRALDRVPAVLEVKFTDKFPFWIRRMVDRFELARVSLAKYVLCVRTMVEDGAIWNANGEALPAWTP